MVDEFRKVLKDRQIKGVSVEAVRSTGCHGFCEQGPLVIIEPEGTFYTKVKASHVQGIVDATLRHGEVVEKHLFTNPSDGKKVERYPEVAFFKHQQRIALRNLGKIAPHDINEYIAQGRPIRRWIRLCTR